MWRIHPIKKIILFSLVASITLGIIAPLSTAYADPSIADSMTPTHSALSTQLYRWMSRCIISPRSSGVDTEADAQAGKWFGNGGTNPRIGYFLTGSNSGIDVSSPPDKVGCADTGWIKTAATLWGYTGDTAVKDFYCDIGAKPNNGLTCQQGLSSGTNGAYGKLDLRTFQTKIASKIGGAPDIRPNTAAEYALNKAVFTTFCLGSNNPSPINPPPAAGTPAYELLYQNLTLVDSSGTPTVGDYLGKQKPSDETWAWLNASYNDNKVSCSAMAITMNKDAAIYASTVASLPDGDSTTPIIPGTGSGDTPNATTCAIGGIGWIVCPVVNFMAGLADHAYNYIADNFLSVKIEMFDTTNPTYSAWSIMRSFANVAFVIAFLIIIFSQLTGFGIANYGIKKLLPRIIIAAILVNLSYFICQFAVDLSNILGKSMHDLFMGLPVPKGNQSTGAWSHASGWSDVAVIILAGVAGVVFWSALTALIPVLIAVVVALVMVLFILVARQAIIILLVVIAPLAFVAYLLPNTEQWFTKWRKLLTSMLLLYPIVALVYGVSTFASKILGGTMDTGPLATRLLGQIAAASVAVLPLFLIPSLLKKSLDGVGKIGASLNNLGSRVGKAGGQKYTNSGYNQHRVAKQNDMKARTMTGNYRGRGGNWNPRNLRSKLNSRVNRNSLANFATGGYAASRELAGQTQDRKDIAEAMEMFGHDDDLALAWAKDGGKQGVAYNALKFPSQKAQYDRMRTAGLDRKASSHIAAAQMISTGGKGDYGATEVIQALKNAREHGASETTVGGETEQAKSAFRKAGRGDALAALKTAGGVPTTAAEGWSEVAPSTVHREALKDTAGKLEYQNYLSLKPDNTRAALAGYDQMEGRAQTAATSSILAAADEHAENAYLAAEAVKKGSGVRVDITTIQQAKAHFGVR